MRRRCWKSLEFLGPIFFVNEILKRGEWGPTWGVIFILLCGLLRFLKVLHGYLANPTGPVAPPSLRGMFGLQVDVESISAFRGGFALSTGSMESSNWQYSLLVSEVCIALAMIPRTRKNMKKL